MSNSGIQYGTHFPPRDLDEALAQLRGGDFKCAKCRNYQGGCGCKQGVLILVVGQDMSLCQYYSPGIRCRHCGKMT